MAARVATYVHERADDGDDAAASAPQATPSKRRRNPNITALIKRARKAGERGPVRVELVALDGMRTIVTSSSEPAPEVMTTDEAEGLWQRRIDNAPH
jgi:hypothetical protein